MSDKETGEAVATIAGRVLSRGNPLDDPTFVGALIEALAESNSGQAAMTACRTAFQPYMADMLSLAGSALSQVEPGEKIKMSIEVDWEKVTNAFVGAIEGASTDWLQEFYPGTDNNSQTMRRAIQLNNAGPWYSVTSYWSEGGQAKLRFDNPNDGPEQESMEMGKAEIMLGLHHMADKAPKHFAVLINEEDDAITHDVMLQFIVFGDIIYG